MERIFKPEITDKPRTFKLREGLELDSLMYQISSRVKNNMYLNDIVSEIEKEQTIEKQELIAKKKLKEIEIKINFYNSLLERLLNRKRINLMDSKQEDIILFKENIEEVIIYGSEYLIFGLINKIDYFFSRLDGELKNILIEKISEGTLKTLKTSFPENYGEIVEEKPRVAKNKKIEAYKDSLREKFNMITSKK